MPIAHGDKVAAIPISNISKLNTLNLCKGKGNREVGGGRRVVIDMAGRPDWWAAKTTAVHCQENCGY